MTTNAPTTTQPRPFRRSTSNKVFAGVSGGLGDYFGADPIMFRIGFIAGTLITGGVAAIAYVALALVRPDDAQVQGPVSPPPVVGPPVPA